MRITLSTGTAAEMVGEGPALVLWPDVFGLRPLFVEHAERLAADLSMTVVVPEMFPGMDDAPVDEKFRHVGSMRDADMLADLDAAIDAAGATSASVVGFCMGGMRAMKSLASPRVKRAVAFYGMVRMPDGWASEFQGDALDVVTARAAAGDLELLCLFGGGDPWCPAADQDDVEAAGATVVRYPGAGHGWAQDPERDGYRPDDAADAWARTEAFLTAP